MDPGVRGHRVNANPPRTNEQTNERTYEHTNGRTEKRSLYTPRHKCRGYKNYIPLGINAGGIMKELEWSQDFFHYKSMGIFPIAQGQLTLQSLVRSGRISNSSEILWMFSLPASMKKIPSKMKALEWTQHFPHYNPMGAICCHGNQSSNPTWSKT